MGAVFSNMQSGLCIKAESFSVSPQVLCRFKCNKGGAVHVHPQPESDVTQVLKYYFDPLEKSIKVWLLGTGCNSPVHNFQPSCCKLCQQPASLAWCY